MKDLCVVLTLVASLGYVHGSTMKALFTQALDELCVPSLTYTPVQLTEERAAKPKCLMNNLLQS